MKLNVIERLIHWSYCRVLNGYARVFANGLFHLENLQQKFEVECKEVALQLVQACLKLDSRLKALESKGDQ